MSRHLCVYCSSSDQVDPAYLQSARDMGSQIGQHRDTLVFGGGKIGLMGQVAMATHKAGGKVIGIIPESMRADDIDYADADELIWTDHMRTRKHAMELRSDAFITLPGGFGTLEEVAEITVLKQLHYHGKPIVIVNIHGFYDPLLSFFDHLIEQQFAKPKTRNLYHVCQSVEEVYPYLMHYEPGQAESKFA